jgi:hypothetical protein
MNMKNQHTKIKGYRDLSQEEIDAMNKVKSLGVQIGAMIEELEAMSSTDKRWVAVAKTDLQIGIMLAVRSVAQPTTF